MSKDIPTPTEFRTEDTTPSREKKTENESSPCFICDSDHRTLPNFRNNSDAEIYTHITPLTLVYIDIPTTTLALTYKKITHKEINK